MHFSGLINGCFSCDDYVIHPKGVEFFRLPHVTMPGCDPGGASDYLEDCVNCGIPRKSKHFPRCLNCGVITGYTSDGWGGGICQSSCYGVM